MAVIDVVSCPGCAEPLARSAPDEAARDGHDEVAAAASAPVGSAQSLYHAWCWREFRAVAAR